MVFVDDYYRASSQFEMSRARITITDGKKTLKVKMKTENYQKEKFWLAGCLRITEESFQWKDVGRFLHDSPKVKAKHQCTTVVWDEIKDDQRKTKHDDDENTGIIVDGFVINEKRKHQTKQVNSRLLRGRVLTQSSHTTPAYTTSTPSSAESSTETEIEKSVSDLEIPYIETTARNVYQEVTGIDDSELEDIENLTRKENDVDIISTKPEFQTNNWVYETSTNVPSNTEAFSVPSSPEAISVPSSTESTLYYTDSASSTTNVDKTRGLVFLSRTDHTESDNAITTGPNIGEEISSDRHRNINRTQKQKNTNPTLQSQTKQFQGEYLLTEALLRAYSNKSTHQGTSKIKSSSNIEKIESTTHLPNPSTIEATQLFDLRQVELNAPEQNKENKQEERTVILDKERIETSIKGITNNGKIDEQFNVIETTPNRKLQEDQDIYETVTTEHLTLTKKSTKKMRRKLKVKSCETMEDVKERISCKVLRCFNNSDFCF
jgi:hypothetical protein